MLQHTLLSSKGAASYPLRIARSPCIHGFRATLRPSRVNPLPLRQVLHLVNGKASLSCRARSPLPRLSCTVGDPDTSYASSTLQGKSTPWAWFCARSWIASTSC